MNLVGDVSFFAVIRVAVPGQTVILSGQCSWHSALPANAVVSWNRTRRWKTSFIILSAEFVFQIWLMQQYGNVFCCCWFGLENLTTSLVNRQPSTPTFSSQNEKKTHKMERSVSETKRKLGTCWRNTKLKISALCFYFPRPSSLYFISSFFTNFLNAEISSKKTSLN